MNIPNFGTKPFQFEDHATARAIVLALGLSDFLRDGTAKAAMTTRFVRYRVHPTHWILVIGFGNMPNRRENGYVVRGYPKHIYPSPTIMDEDIASLADGDLSHATIHPMIAWVPMPYNN